MSGFPRYYVLVAKYHALMIMETGPCQFDNKESVEFGFCCSGPVSSKTCCTGSDSAAQPANTSLLMWAIQLGSIWIPLCLAHPLLSSGSSDRKVRPKHAIGQYQCSWQQSCCFWAQRYSTCLGEFRFDSQRGIHTKKIPLLHNMFRGFPAYFISSHLWLTWRSHAPIPTEENCRVWNCRCGKSHKQEYIELTPSWR